MNSYQQRLALILQSHDAIASAIQRVASDLPSAVRRRLKRLGQRFGQQMSVEQAIGDPDALAILLPLMKANRERFDPSQIDHAVGHGLAMISRQSQSPRGWLVALTYPLLLLCLGFALFIGYCIFLVPMFESLYADFGLGLPWLTSAVISVSHVIRQYMVPVGMIVLLLAIAWMPFPLSSFGRQANGSRKSSLRTAWADWAWHVALLLDAGVSHDHALKIASNRSGNAWVQRAASNWEAALRQGLTPEVQTLPAYRLLTAALQLERTSDKVDLLREVAVIYRERQQNVSRWRVAWVTPVTVVVVGSVAGTLVAAFLMPMLQLISSLR